MSHKFSMHTVLRRAPFKVLRWMLPRVGIELGLDWEKMHAYDLPKVIAAYETQPQEKKEQAEAVACEIFELADQDGVNALREAAKLCNVSYWDVMFRENASAYLQALWAWTSHRDVFEKAKKLLQINHSPCSRKRTGLPVGEAPFSDDKLAELKSAIQSFFLEKQDRGRVCTVEAFEKGNGKYCIFAYPDDRPTPKLYHDEKEELCPKIDSSVFAVLFIVDTIQGTVELSAKLSKTIQKELEDVFIRTLYGVEPPPASEPVCNLDILKDPRLVLATEPQDCLSAEVSCLGVKWKEIDSNATFGCGKKGSFVRPITHLQGCPPEDLKGAEVRNAVVRFHFRPKPGRRAGVLCVEITSPTNMVIRCKDLQRVEIMQYYLKKWGIVQ